MSRTICRQYISQSVAMRFLRHVTRPDCELHRIEETDTLIQHSSLARYWNLCLSIVLTLGDRKL